MTAKCEEKFDRMVFMKKTLFAILTVGLTAIVTVVLLTACAGSPKSKGAQSEIIITVIDDDYDFLITIKNEDGEIIFPRGGGNDYEIKQSNKKKTVSVPVPNGKYTVSFSSRYHRPAYTKKLGTMVYRYPAEVDSDFKVRPEIPLSLNNNLGRVTLNGNGNNSIVMGSMESRGGFSEIVITISGFENTNDPIQARTANMVSVWIQDEANKTIYPNKKQSKDGYVYFTLTSTRTTITRTIPVPNGNYTVYSSKGYIHNSAKVYLENSRADIKIIANPVNRQARLSIVATTPLDIIARIDAAVPKVFSDIDATLSANLKPNATIAVFPITATYTEYAEIALENLTTLFVNSNKYTVVEKRRVEELLAEYDFQLSGLVGEKTLGELLGADAVIFSNLSDDGQISSFAVDTSRRTTLAKSEPEWEVKRTAIFPDLAVLPITGGTNNEAATITSFLTNNYMFQKRFDVSDKSGDEAVSQYAGLFSSLTFRERLQLNTISTLVFSGTVQQVGRKNMFVLNANSRRGGMQLRSFEYTDSLELWVKLQHAVGSILSRQQEIVTRPGGRSYERDRSAFIYSQFGTGVNSGEAEMLTQLLITDTLTLPVQGYTMVQMTDETRSTEQRQRNTGDFYFNFNWSRRGNRNRLDITVPHVRSDPRYSLEYGSPQEFMRKMRGLSVFIFETVAINYQISGFEGYDLVTVTEPARIPANFTKLTRVVTQQGVPSGGFYISKTPVTQREYETIMRQNPSLVRNPTQPVNNVSIIDVMLFCNKMSIRDGLEPAYIIERNINQKSSSDLTARERELIRDTSISHVSLDPFASGYRLATTDEWMYARDKIEEMGVLAEYVFDGSLIHVPREGLRAAHLSQHGEDGGYSRFSAHEGSSEFTVGNVRRSYFEELGAIPGTVNRRVRVAPVIRLVRPIFDYWKYTSGQ